MAKCMFDLLWRTFRQRGIGYTPMRRHRLPRPDGTHFLLRIVANGEDKIHLRRFRFGKLFPALAAQIPSRQVRHFDQLERFRPHNSRWVASHAVSGEKWLAFAVKNGLRHDRPGGIPGAQEQHAVVPLHRRRPSDEKARSQSQHVGAQHASAVFAASLAFVARTNALINLPSTCGAIAFTSSPFSDKNSRASSTR